MASILGPGLARTPCKEIRCRFDHVDPLGRVRRGRAQHVVWGPEPQSSLWISETRAPFNPLAKSARFTVVALIGFSPMFCALGLDFVFWGDQEVLGRDCKIKRVASLPEFHY
jgi:hypothetical protein